MKYLRYTPVALLIALLITPFVFQGGEDAPPADAPILIIVSPHNEQIRGEFSRAFEAWHEKQFNAPVRVVWSTPGGTSEIRKLLVSEYTAALEHGLPPGGNADLMWGGGSYEFGVLARPITATVNGEEKTTRILEKVDFSAQYLESVYGDGEIAGDPLFNHEGYWFGTALSSFGIVYNRDLLHDLGLKEPREWEDLAVPGYRDAITLVNPGMSGSVTTAFEALLERRSWRVGWRVLRRMAANARAFAGSSTKGPLDVADGSAAAAVCIDFYGRYEAQRTRSAAIKSGAPSDTPGRIGYIDPPGETKIDPDPVGLLRGAPHPKLARRFIEFVLSEDGQALWQYPIAKIGPGPRWFELRRLPIRRSMYNDHFDMFVDKVDPWVIALPVQYPNRAMRAFIAPLFQAMALDQPKELRRAWNAIVNHPGYPKDGLDVVTAKDVTDKELKRMLEAFDAMPVIHGPSGTPLSLADPGSLAEVKAGWLRGGWKGDGLWPPEADPTQALRQLSRRFFGEKYRQIEKIAAGGGGV
jgi:iron(III) transport system substrate-binding protein